VTEQTPRHSRGVFYFSAPLYVLRRTLSRTPRAQRCAKDTAAGKRGAIGLSETLQRTQRAKARRLPFKIEQKKFRTMKNLDASARKHLEN